MEAYYWTRPTAAELEGTMYKPSDYAEPEVEVWDENWAAFQLYCRYQTQWRVGNAGPIGLDFNVFHAELQRRGITGDEFDTCVDQLLVIEAAARKELTKTDN